MEKGLASSEFIIKSSNKRHSSIMGYASVFDTIDTQNDMIVKGAFKNTDPKKVKLLWQHETKTPIGIIKFLEEDEYGLKMEAEINNYVSKGSEAIQLIKQTAICGLSVGFIIKSSDYNKKGIRVINDLQLIEISIVTFPANKNAAIVEVKNEDETDLSELDRLIKELKIY